MYVWFCVSLVVLYSFNAESVKKNPPPRLDLLAAGDQLVKAEIKLLLEPHVPSNIEHEEVISVYVALLASCAVEARTGFSAIISELGNYPCHLRCSQ